MKKIIVPVFLFFGKIAFCQMPNTLTNAEKVYGLSRFWQEVNYNFVYLEKVDRKKWDSAYIFLIDKVQETKNDYEYFRLLKRFCAILKDGHTNIEFPGEVQKKVMKTMFGEYRFLIENIDGKAIITHVNFSKKGIVPPGSEILEVNGQSTRNFSALFVKPYIASSTEHVLENMATENLLEGIEGDSFELKIRKPGGEVVVFSVTHSKSSETELYPPMPNPNKIFEFKWIEPKVAYVALNSFESEDIITEFTKSLSELENAKGLIIDLRRNGGGDHQVGLEILKYLLPSESVLGAKSQTRNHIATYKAWGEMVKPADTASNAEFKMAYLNYSDKYYYNFPISSRSIKIPGKKIIIPTVVLIGNMTASAAEDFLIYAYNQPHFTTLGSPTFGSTGQPYYFMLPGGSQARVCTKKDTYPDGKEFVGTGILPDVVVKRTLSDYLKGRDPELEKATLILNDKTNAGKMGQ